MRASDEVVIFVNQPWLQQLDGYFRHWADQHEMFMFPEVRFVEEVNKVLARNHSKETLDAGKLKTIMKGGEVSADVRTALCQVFDIYGDIGANFRSSYDDHARGLVRQAAVEKDRLGTLRETNPDGKLDKKSFAELLEEAYHETLMYPEERITLGEFIHNRVLAEWGTGGKAMGTYAFCDMLKARDAKVRGGGFMVPSTLNKWKHATSSGKEQTPKTTIKLPTMEAFVKAFKLDLAHELMFWRIINGKPFCNPYRDEEPERDQVSELQAAVNDAVAAKSHGRLVGAFLESSGIPRDRLQEIAGSSGMYHWEHSDSVIDTPKAAGLYLDAVLAPFAYLDADRTADIRKQLEPLLTGRSFDVEHMLKEAKREGIDNPGGELFKLMTGKRGAIYISDKEMIAAFAEKGIAVSQSKMDGMRCTTRSKHDNIYENVAEAILAIVEEKSGNTLTEKQCEDCMEVLTGFPSASQMMKQLKEGAIKPGRIAQTLCLRRNINFEDLADKVGCSRTTMTDFMHDRESLGHKFARGVCRALGIKNDNARLYVVAATGHDISVRPGKLLEEALAKPTAKERVPELRRIYDWSAMTREELAEASGIGLSTLNRAILSETGGTISAPPEDLRALAKLCGLGSKQAAQFAEAFASPWVGGAAGKTRKALPQEGIGM